MRKRDLTSQNKKQGRKLLPALCSVAGTVLFLAVIALLIIPSLPKLTYYEIFNVVSGSMEPKIPVGSLIIVEPREASQVEEGEVIAFMSNGSVITHRVVENLSFEGEFVTKGDANLQEDMSNVPYDHLIGVVIRHYKYLGDVLQYLTTAAGKIYLLLVVSCGIMLNMIAGRLRNS